MNFNLDAFLKIGKDLGVPVALCVALMAMMHFDFAVPMKNGLEKNADFQLKAVERLTSLDESQRNMQYDMRYGTWRVTQPPPPSAVETTAPSPPPMPK